MEGAVTWTWLLTVLGGMQVATAVLVYYFTNRSKDMEAVRKMISETLADVEAKHSRYEAKIEQEHANLHERINRTNEKIPVTERALRTEFSAMMDKVEERLGKRIDGVLAGMRSISGDIIKAVHERHERSRSD